MRANERWHGSDGNEGIVFIPQSSTDWSLTIRSFNIISKTLVGGILRLSTDAVCIFFDSNRLYSPSIVI